MRDRRPLYVIFGIMGAVLTWGMLHALGSFLFNHDFRKPVIVYGMVLAFLLFWSLMLLLRERRLRKTDRAENSPRT